MNAVSDIELAETLYQGLHSTAQEPRVIACARCLQDQGAILQEFRLSCHMLHSLVLSFLFPLPPNLSSTKSTFNKSSGYSKWLPFPTIQLPPPPSYFLSSSPLSLMCADQVRLSIHNLPLASLRQKLPEGSSDHCPAQQHARGGTELSSVAGAINTSTLGCVR